MCYFMILTHQRRFTAAAVFQQLNVFLLFPQATWTDTTTRPSRSLATTLLCCTSTTGEGKCFSLNRSHEQCLCFFLFFSLMAANRDLTDFGRSRRRFGRHSKDEPSILAPLEQCCRYKRKNVIKGRVRTGA